MALDIIGAGFGRTGTLSLKMGLEKLGFNGCYHMTEAFTNPNHSELWLRAQRGEDVWEQLFDGYRAAVDWPASAFWRPLMDYYPDAVVLLSHRDPDKWFDCATATIFGSMQAGLDSDDPERQKQVQMPREIIVDGTFNGDIRDRAHCKAIFEANVAAVRAEVPADRLLEWQASDGWEPLCERFGVPVPDEPFPRVNSTEEFTERWRKIRGSDADGSR